MGFHEVQFPVTISYGFDALPAYSTAIVEVDSGAEERVSRWASSRRRYNAARGFGQDEAYAVLEFFEARQGDAYGFRFKDWTDYATCANGVTHSPDGGSVAFDDVLIGTGDASGTKVFSLVKKYTSGAVTRTRTIEKPVSGTVKVAVDVGMGPSEAEATSLGWSVSTSTGEITFTTAPTDGDDVYAGFEFDVPVRFDTGRDGLGLTVPAHDSTQVPDIPLVEVTYEGAVSEMAWGGGAKNWGAITADQAITEADGRVHRFSQTTASLAIVLPTADTLPAGGPWFMLENQGSEDLEVENDEAVSAGTLTVGNAAQMWISIDSGGNKTWVLFG